MKIVRVKNGTALHAADPRAKAAGHFRQERDQLQGTVNSLAQRGGRVTMRDCGPEKRLCVMVDKTAGSFGMPGTNKGDVYIVAKGY